MNFISYPVINAFTSAAAITIGFGQVKVRMRERERRKKGEWRERERGRERQRRERMEREMTQQLRLFKISFLPLQGVLGLSHIPRDFPEMVYETCKKIPETK